MLDPLTLLPAVSPYLRFSGDQECYYEEDLRILSSMSKKEHMKGNETMLDFRTSKFVLRISRDSYQVSSLGGPATSKSQHRLGEKCQGLCGN